jgi:hypothetical protein
MTRKLLLAFLLSLACASAQPPAGRWDGAIEIGALKVPFRIDFEGDGKVFRGALVNGGDRVSSLSGSFEDRALRLVFAPSGLQMDAVLSEDGRLKGSFGSADGRRPFAATAFCTCGFEGEAGPDIAGAWEAPGAGWRLTVRRKGEDTFAVVSRPGGDLGPVAGRFDGVSFQLHYFDGARAAVLEMEPRKDGALDVIFQEPGAEVRKFRAVRAGP